MWISVKYGIFKFLLINLAVWAIFVSKAFCHSYMESFPNGKSQLNWNFFPHFFLDNLQAVRDLSAPDGDGGVGVLRNSNAGGFAALSYAITEEVDNFTLEAYVFCPVSVSDKGPLTGLAFLIDPIDSRFYRFICDFNRKEPNLNIAYVGKDTNHFPVYLRLWKEKEIPGGIPKISSWHKMKIKVKNGKGYFFWNEVQLKGEYDVSRINKGFIGVYTNFVGGRGQAETKIDSLILILE